jgi:hypothetical protein
MTGAAGGLTNTIPYGFRLERVECKRKGERQTTIQGAMKVTPAKLENTELSLVARVNRAALLVIQYLFAQRIHPQHCNGERKQQGIQAFGAE